jgi:glutathione-independent formaldehyde dehydrogenase
VFIPNDPGAADELAKRGEIVFDWGLLWFKGQSLGTGKAKPSFVVSHELPLTEAPVGYEHFDKRDNGWTKVVLHPAA